MEPLPGSKCILERTHETECSWWTPFRRTLSKGRMTEFDTGMQVVRSLVTTEVP